MQTFATLLRQWVLLRTLSSQGGRAGVKLLAERAGVSEKTVRRDLDLLCRAGFPIQETTGKFNRKTYDLQTADLPQLGFTYDEALAFFFCRRAVLPLAGTLISESANAAFRKIQASLGERAAKYVEKMLDRVHQTHVGGAYAGKAELIDQLQIAIEECKATFITYHSSRSSEPLTYDIHPYGLTEHRGSLYVVGHSQQHGEIRHWKVDRIEATEMTKMPFRRPKDFRLDEHFADSLGVYQGKGHVRVRARFAPSAARYIREKQMHASQRITPERDGAALAEWTLSSTVEIKSFLLSFGAAAEVLEPEELRAEMAAEAGRLLANYKTVAKVRNKP